MAGDTRAESGAEARSLEERLRELEDEREIRDLLIRYAACLDRRDFPGYSALFTEDGHWYGRAGDVRGRAAIEQMLLDSFGPTPEGFVNTGNFHLMTNFLIEVDGDTARADSRITYFARGDNDRPAPMLAGRYEDEFVRVDGHWLFASRQVIGEIPTIAEAPVPTPEERGS
jgi:uncharacterized protein (TIGR02246 family)